MAELMICGKAQAKLIVIGEHFVVPFKDSHGVEHAGSAALAVPLPGLCTEVKIFEHTENSCQLDPSTQQYDIGARALELMDQAVRFSANRFHWDLAKNPIKVISGSNFPVSRGLGSSASFSVALARGFRELSGRADVDMRTEAQQIENLFHGKSSGLDTSAILSDSPILYQSGRVLDTFSRRAVDLVVADSGPRESSATLVSKTQELRRNQPDFWMSLSNQIGELVGKCFKELQNPDGALEVARLVRHSQEILTQIGLMNSQLSEILEIGEKSGALAGKMSGAGAGGIVLFVTRPGDGLVLAERLKTSGARVVAVA
jgi:mevalonate kinase